MNPELCSVKSGINGLSIVSRPRDTLHIVTGCNRRAGPSALQQRGLKTVAMDAEKYRREKPSDESAMDRSCALKTCPAKPLITVVVCLSHIELLRAAV